MLTGWFDKNNDYIVEDSDGHIVKFGSKEEAIECYGERKIDDITDLMNEKSTEE